LKDLATNKCEDLLNSISEFPLFFGLPNEAIKLILEKSKIISFPRKAIIYYQNEPNDRLYIIISGQVKISKFTDDGKEVSVEILGDSEAFGYISLIEDKSCECTVTTLTKADILAVRKYEFLKLIRNYPIIINSLLKNACIRLRNAYNHIENISSSNAQKRIARILLELARQEGEYVNNVLIFNSHLTHQELGNLAGTSRETVTRALTYFKKNGYIKVARSKVTFLKEDEMEEIL